VSREHVADYLLVECAKWHGRTGMLIASAPGFDRGEHSTYLDVVVRDAGRVRIPL
jgi:hypothetical protein